MDGKFLVKKKSKIHGEGIFTTKPIKRNDILYLVPINKTDSRPHKRWAYIGKRMWVDDPEVLNFINHSCNPNTKLDIKSNQPKLITIRDIKKDEEITCDYSLTEKKGRKIKCNCKGKACRGYFLRIE